MGIMTLTALAVCDRRVNTYCPAQALLKISVTGDAETFLPLNRNTLVIAGMGIVAGQALAVFKRRMQ